MKTSAPEPEMKESRVQSCYDATLMNADPPAIYQLKTERAYICETNRKVRRWTYGQKDRNKQNKVILMVGETGSGKTTIINTMTNHLLGVKFEDQEWYEITDEEGEDIDESQSKTREITVYEVFVEENPTSLTIIDTPGYGHTEGYEKDKEISEYLSRLFSDEDGIDYIDAVCFVMKASQNRLSGKELYIFHSVLSLFGRDIEDNIVFLLTHSDGQRPTDALGIIKKAQIPCRKDGKKQPVHFLFNNQQKEKGDACFKSVLKSAWEMGDENMNRFLTLLEESNRKSVQMTLDVLNERRRLEACASNLKDRINEEEFKIKKLTEIQKSVKENRDKIEKCENFQFTVETTVKEKVLNVNGWWWNRNTTCCSVCEENCHEWHCWMAIDASWCTVMKNEHCTVCTGKCHYSKHVREKNKYVIETNTVTMTFKELKQEYERTSKKPKTRYDKKIFGNITKEHERNMNESENKRKIEEKLIRDLEKIEIEKSHLLHESYKTVMSLSEIALKADSAFTLQHLDFLIPRLKEEGKDEWMKNLEELRKAGEEKKNKGALQHVKIFTGQKWKQTENYVTAMASSTDHRGHKSLEEPPEIIAGGIRLKDEFIELYERDYPQLQQRTEKLRSIVKTFETGYRRATEGSRHAGWMGIFGGALIVAGLVALFTLGTSHLAHVAAAVFMGAMCLSDSRFNSITCFSGKKWRMTQLKQDVEAELEEFQDKMTLMAEKINDIHERREQILNKQDAIRIEDTADLTAQMSETICWIASVTSVPDRFSLVLDMFSVFQNTSVLNDMNRLAKAVIPEQIDESEMTSEAGKFIVGMRKLIHQLQSILDKLEKTKDKIVIY